MKKLLCLLTVIAVGTMPCLLPGETAPLKSAKRGIGVNTLSREHAELFAPGISWAYNWGPNPGNVAVAEGIEFLPMVWTGSLLDGAETYLQSGARPSAILFLNEPNFALPLGSYVAPEPSAELLETTRERLASYGLPIIGPHMALGGTADESITAYDPIAKEEVTYTDYLSFLDAFDYYLGEPGVEALGVHSYGGFGDLEWAVNSAYDRYGKPVWVSEFAFWNAPDVDAQMDYMINALHFLERSPRVARYAWFKADLGARDTKNLLNSGTGSLTRLGNLYVNYPAYDPEYYHPVDTRIEAESYVHIEQFQLTRADRDEGMAALFGSQRQESWAHYQIDVPEAGEYEIRMRISSDAFSETGTLGVNATPVMVTRDEPVGRERDVRFRASLEAGPQVIRFWVKGLNGKFDWFEVLSLE